MFHDLIVFCPILLIPRDHWNLVMNISLRAPFWGKTPFFLVFKFPFKVFYDKPQQCKNQSNSWKIPIICLEPYLGGISIGHKSPGSLCQLCDMEIMVPNQSKNNVSYILYSLEQSRPTKIGFILGTFSQRYFPLHWIWKNLRTVLFTER